jgi:hypothetical protein
LLVALENLEDGLKLHETLFHDVVALVDKYLVNCDFDTFVDFVAGTITVPSSISRQKRANRSKGNGKFVASGSVGPQKTEEIR